MMNRIVRRACLYKPDEIEKSTVSTSTAATTTTTTTTTNFSVRRAKGAAEKMTENGGKDDVLVEPINSAGSYSALVSF